METIDARDEGTDWRSRYWCVRLKGVWKYSCDSLAACPVGGFFYNGSCYFYLSSRRMNALQDISTNTGKMVLSEYKRVCRSFCGKEYRQVMHNGGRMRVECSEERSLCQQSGICTLKSSADSSTSDTALPLATRSPVGHRNDRWILLRSRPHLHSNSTVGKPSYCRELYSRQTS